MPIYEYQCKACNTITETIASHDQTEIDCACGKGKAVRILSGFAVGRGQTTSPCGDGSCGLGGDTAVTSGSAHAPGCACCHAAKH